jgi:hypothetical protein
MGKLIAKLFHRAPSEVAILTAYYEAAFWQVVDDRNACVLTDDYVKTLLY